MAPAAPRPRQLFQLSKWLNADGAVTRAICRAAERLLGFDAASALYAGLPPRESPQEFFHLFLEALHVSLDYDEVAWRRIPAHGPCVVVANHPFGMIEGIALGALLAPVRPDFKFLGNYLLEEIPDIKPFNLPVNPFGEEGEGVRNVPSLRAALRWLTGGGVLVLFPAGVVAHFDPWQRRVTDPPWQPNLARLVRRAQAPILPVHFAGTNGPGFHLLGLVHPMLRTLRLPRELLNKRGATLSIDVGAVLLPDALDASAADAEWMNDLRARTFALGGSRQRPGAPGAAEPTTAPAVPAATMASILPPGPVQRIVDEIGQLPPGCRLVEAGDFLVACAEADRIPHTLFEIGRQREIAFREVGEGTGNSIDLDRFDEYYHHLFVWNRQAAELVGAYRIGPVDEIIQQRGLAGLYTSTLFRYDATLLDRIGPTLEMGRSFVRAEYQRTFSALHHLWRGIGEYVARRPRYRYLLGAVSISNEYSSMSQQLMTSFLQANHLAGGLSDHVSAHNPVVYEAVPTAGAGDALEPIPDLNALSARVLELESGRRSIPILLRQYLKLGGRLLGVNRDSQFHNAIDGLILVDLLAAPRRVLERYLGTEGLQKFQAYHAREDARISS
jgi:putative hemolysin